MTLKRLMTMCVVGGALCVISLPVSAQEWWNPAGWMRPAYPAYGYRGGPGYRPACPGGVCAPERYGYGVGYAPQNSCGPFGCAPLNRGRGGYGYDDYRYSAPRYAPTIPDYDDDRDVPVPQTWGTGYRGRMNDRREMNPFYE